MEQNNEPILAIALDCLEPYCFPPQPFQLHQAIEAAALEAAEPEVAHQMYRLHAEVGRKRFAAHYEPAELRAEYELSDEQLDRAW